MKPYVMVALHQQEREGNFPGRKVPPGWLLEKIWNEKVSGGYTAKRNPACPICHVRKSNSGDCFC